MQEMDNQSSIYHHTTLCFSIGVSDVGLGRVLNASHLQKRRGGVESDYACRCERNELSARRGHLVRNMRGETGGSEGWCGSRSVGHKTLRQERTFVCRAVAPRSIRWLERRRRSQMQCYQHAPPRSSSAACGPSVTRDADNS